MIHALFAQYGAWTFKNALYLPPHTYVDLFSPIPALWILACFAPRISLWHIVLGLFLIVFFLVPVSRYCLPVIPFLCLLAVQGYQVLKDRLPTSRFLAVIIFLFILSLPAIAHIPMDIIRPWRARPYGLMDTRYIASKLPETLESPIWTNDCSLYLFMGWRVPTFDLFNAAEVPGPPIDWGNPPFSGIKTRVELLPTATPMGHEPDVIPGWTTEIIPLERGAFTKLRIRRKK